VAAAVLAAALAAAAASASQCSASLDDLKADLEIIKKALGVEEFSFAEKVRALIRARFRS
jgi:hypothetical protein